MKYIDKEKEGRKKGRRDIGNIEMRKMEGRKTNGCEKNIQNSNVIYYVNSNT